MKQEYSTTAKKGKSKGKCQLQIDEKRSTLINISMRKKIREESKQEKDVLKITRHKNA